MIGNEKPSFMSKYMQTHVYTSISDCLIMNWRKFHRGGLQRRGVHLGYVSVLEILKGGILPDTTDQLGTGRSNDIYYGRRRDGDEETETKTNDYNVVVRHSISRPLLIMSL